MQVPQLSNFINRVIHKLAHYKSGDEDASSSLVEINDLNYEDALFDAQVRSCLHTEYGDKEPPPLIFSQLTHAIRLHEQEQELEAHGGRSKVAPAWLAVTASRLTIRLRQATLGIYRAGSSAGTSRVLSGGLVTVLLMLAMGPDLMQVLSGATRVGTLQESRSDSTVVASVSPTGPQYPVYAAMTDSQMRLLLEQRTGEDFDAPYQIQEVPPLDPAELRLVKKNAGTDDIEPARKLNAKGPQ